MSPTTKPKFRNPRAKFNFEGSCSIAVSGPTSRRVSDQRRSRENGQHFRRVDHHSHRNQGTPHWPKTSSPPGARAALRDGSGRCDGRGDRFNRGGHDYPDMPFPSTAALIQRKLAHTARPPSISKRPALGLSTPWKSPSSSSCPAPTTRCGIGAKTLFKLIGRTATPAFCSETALEPARNRPNAHGLLTAVMGADGRKADLLLWRGRQRCPATAQSVDARLHYLRGGQGNFQERRQAMETAAAEALRRCELEIYR